MNNQANFMDTLRSVAEIVRVSGEPVKREDIKNYFGDMNLTEEQVEMVYQYLLNPPAEEPAPEEEEEEETTTADYEEEDLVKEEQPEQEQKLSDSLFFQMYMEDIEELPKISEAEEMALYETLLSGDNYVVSAIADHWLRKVIDHAKTYQNRNVIMEDLIQEGNIGLLCGIQSLVGASISAKEVPAALLDSINQAMIEFIDEYSEEEDLETTVLAKTNLIYEAKKALAETLGREASMEELCNYTNMPLEEVTDIITLAEAKKDK
ncbi:MAG: sigma-70 domain-containing protein [bacterium]|nr:sigma-70 domain-containing protein [bacterium]